MRNTYLVFYNLLQLCGWFAILYTGRLDLLIWFQTIQMIEVVHCLVGLVKSSAFQTFLQILSRVSIVWIALVSFPGTRESIGLDLILWAWPIAETTRYIYYALNLLKLNLFIVTWARYTFFIVLYPMGVTGELLIAYKLMEELRRTKFLDFPLPNPLNISIYGDIATALIILVTYGPEFPKLYMYMLYQRKKFLGGKPGLSKEDTKTHITRGQRQKSD